MYTVFISYSHDQLAWATHLRSGLNGPGIQAYVADHDLPAGLSLSENIIQQIKGCDLFLLLWTEAARASQYVQKELFLAISEGKAIIPVVLQPGVPMPSELGDVKYLDLVRDPMGHVGWLKSEIERRAGDKRVSNFVALGLAGFLAWVILGKGD